LIEIIIKASFFEARGFNEFQEKLLNFFTVRALYDAPRR
jgi:hypothetical protein